VRAGPPGKKQSEITYVGAAIHHDIPFFNALSDPARQERLVNAFHGQVEGIHRVQEHLLALNVVYF
jgi:hypothetical protein